MINDVFQQIEKMASGTANVHIYGEIGTGKQAAAEMIHRLSGRNAYALITIDCAVHQKKSMWYRYFEDGQSIHAKAEKHIRKFFRQAGAATLIMHNINQMGFDLQDIFLRIIKQNENITVKNAPARASSRRIITTSCCDPRTLWSNGIIKLEFLEHIDPVLIKLKPLRSCKQDLPALANHYFSFLGNKAQTQHLPESIMQRLLAYDWPGNLYELQNTIQRYLVYDEITFLPVRTTSVRAKKADQKRTLPLLHKKYG